MADEIPVIPKAGNILVHTGNIVNWNLLKKVTQSPTEELTECFDSTLEGWIKNQDKNELQFATDLECLNTKFLQKLTEEEREGIKLTVKIFLIDTDKAAVCEAINKALCELGTSYIENVLVSLPETHSSDLRPVWTALEECVDSDNVLSLGVSDLSKTQLEELYNWAKVKPTVAQVNLSTCCVVPPEMQEYAKHNQIQLLTHSDPADILPVKTFQDILLKRLTTRDAENWTPAWVVRYSALIKGRGIIKSKGYIFKATRDVKRRK